jgi:FMN-dependent NADH-azoreductase
LYLEASPRKARSHSIDVATAFVEAFTNAKSNNAIEKLDLWSIDLPPFDGAAVTAKYKVMHGEPMTPEEEKAWARITEIFGQFAAHDHYLISLPMWNFGIPYRLKHYIDVITQPGMAVKVTEDGGYEGLVTGRSAVVVYDSGGQYEIGSGAEAYDFLNPYLELWLGFIGFSDIRRIAVGGTMGDREELTATKEKAKEEARQLAAAI